MDSRSSSTDPSVRRPPLCAASPVLHSLLPLMGGILLARSVDGNLAGMMACTGGIILFRLTTDFPVIASLSLLGGFCLTHLEAASPDPDWAFLPPREVRMEIRVEEAFNARKPGHMAGIGKIIQTGLPGRPLRGSSAAFYLESGAAGDRQPVIGETLECRAVLEYLTASGGHDGYKEYLLRRNVYLNLNRGTVLRESAPAPDRERIRQVLYSKSQHILSAGCDEPEDPGNVLSSMLLGDRSRLNDARIELYRRTGSYHLFAVSGLHVGSVALCLFLLTRSLRFPRLLKAIPLLAGTWGYVWLTGSSPSAVRAGIMISCVAVARHLIRQPHLFPALILSAWIVLLLNPSHLFHLGFQLSYAVVASIILVALPLAQFLRYRIDDIQERTPPSTRTGRVSWKLLHAVSDLACVSTSAGLASMPLIIDHFDLFTPGGIVFGIILNPLATLSVMGGCIALLLGLSLTPVLAGYLAMGCWPLIRGMEWLLEICLAIPGSVSYRSWPVDGSGIIVVLTYLGTAWLLQRLRMRDKELPFLTYLLPYGLVLMSLTMTRGIPQG